MPEARAYCNPYGMCICVIHFTGLIATYMYLWRHYVYAPCQVVQFNYLYHVYELIWWFSSPQGLPSMYLHPASPSNLSAIPSFVSNPTGLARLVTNSSSPSNGASLASSLDELAMTLGTHPQDAGPGVQLPDQPPPWTQSEDFGSYQPTGDQGEMGSSGQPSHTNDKIYNPFDSDGEYTVHYEESMSELLYVYVCM